MDKNWNLLLINLLTLDNKEELTIFFDLLLTDTEKLAISSRLRVFNALLFEGMSQRQIASEYSVSTATVTRCSNYLKNMEPSKRKNIENLLITFYEKS